MDLLDGMNLFADIASNHRGDFKTFLQLFDEIGGAGAIPKIQLYSEETFPRRWVDHIGGLKFIPSVFRPEDVDFILPYKPLGLKVASVEATYQDLLLRCLKTDLPLIISTGGMDEEEIATLLYTLEGYPEVCLMHCTSIYPTPKEQLNLGRLAALSEDLEQDDNITIGWSSHYPVVDPAAYALAWAWGATQFEVHVRPVITGWTELATLDEQCSFTPSELKQIRSIIESLPILEGSDDYAGPDREAVLEWRKRWGKL